MTTHTGYRDPSEELAKPQELAEREELAEPQDLDGPQDLDEQQELAEPAEEPRCIDGHLIRNLSPSSTPLEQEEAIQHFMERIMSHGCPYPRCRINTMDDDGSFVFRHAARIIAPIKSPSSLFNLLVVIVLPCLFKYP